MCETKRGPHGEIVGIDGPEFSLIAIARRLWAATDGIRLILLCALPAIVMVVLSAVDVL